MRDVLIKSIDDLPEREKTVMGLYYEQDMNLREIGEVLGVSESRVCQLHSQAIARLRSRISGAMQVAPKAKGEGRGGAGALPPLTPRGISMDSISLVGITLGFAAILVGQVLEGACRLPGPAHRVPDRHRRHPRGGDAAEFDEGFPHRHADVPLGVHAAQPRPRRADRRGGELEQRGPQGGPAGPREPDPPDGGPFIQKGLQLLVDGVEPERLREVLEVEIDTWEGQLKQGAKIWEAAGGYAPTIGILGAVLGLIHVMENLSDPGKLGAGIAVAFVATIYGVGTANLVFLPVSKKLLGVIGTLVSMREMLVDGLVGIANGDNPRIIESRLKGYAG
jgi:chemotaxis protein MotA